MLKFSFLTAGLWLSIATLAHSAETVGFREAQLDEEGLRPLHIAIWYPTEDHANSVNVGENRVFYGIPAVREASPDTRVHPLVVLSHGYGGSSRNLSWLASKLTQHGYIVVAPDHPGTTTFNKDAAQAAMLWKRPHDLSRVIDALTTDPALAGKIDAKRIAAIGHSLGGWTVAELAGARFDTARFEKDCQTHTSPRACSLSAELGLGNGELENWSAP